MPSDPLMNLATADIKSVLIEKYKKSEYARKTTSKAREMSNFVREDGVCFYVKNEIYAYVKVI